MPLKKKTAKMLENTVLLLIVVGIGISAIIALARSLGSSMAKNKQLKEKIKDAKKMQNRSPVSPDDLDDKLRDGKF